MRLGRYLAVLLSCLVLDAAIWHLVSMRLGMAGVIGALAGFAAALALIQLCGLERRARHFLVIGILFASLFSFTLMARMPFLDPLAARAFAALAALSFSLAGFAIYLRKR